MKITRLGAVVGLLAALCFIYGAVGRWQSVRAIREAEPGQTVNLSHDEAVYLTLGKMINQGGSSYNVRDWYKKQTLAGRKLPDYLNRPLFKHPPMLALMLAAVSEPGIEGTRNAFALMAGLGLAVSAAVYGAARIFLPPLWSLAAAAIAWIDPVLWAGSVKVWADLPLALFAFCGAWLAWAGKQRPERFIAAGLCFGLAFLTKYPAIAIWAAMMAILLIEEPGLRRSPRFWIGAALPWVMLAPWLWKTCSVYGVEALGIEETRHALRTAIRHAWLLAAGAIAAVLIAWRHRRREAAPAVEPVCARACFMALFLLATFGLFFAPSWYSPRVEPRGGITMQFFAGESALFYVNRILALDPLLWPGLVAACMIRLPPAASCFRWVSLWFILLFSLWGNYQSRYIMPAIPFLCILSAWFLWRMAEWLRADHGLWLEKVWLGAFVIFAALRLDWIHARLNIPNDKTYF